ncbi:protein of unknown function [Rhizobium sp. AN5]|uniref:DUF4062 domain-containing protein n=1 Tax=Rhizobium sp. AN5 TaxID=1855304 RepID=UPI000BDA7E45|nr:DUF4062 domain-containing protein [Rhizobium sp. AN5]SOC93040.1 protein of unknown function [Rhizobium sp. AN5]
MKKKLQVFVSSTFTDLQTERQAAVQAILKAGHIPAGMELFTASDKSQWEIIKRWIDESDVYMLILGGRYGSVDKETGVSYTEMEYDYAVTQKKPLFSVVIEDEALKDKVQKVGISAIEQENPQALKKFREKVLSTMSAFFADGRDIKLAIHESLGELGHQTDLVGWVSASEIVDVSALHAEISRLKSELDKAKEIKPVARRSKTSGDELEDFKSVLEVLDLTTIEIPEDVIGREGEIRTLSSLMISFSGQLVNGVSQGSNSVVRFLYNTVFPKLIIHDLAANEKPAGSTLRRSYLTEKGKKILALLDKQRLIDTQAEAE